MCIPIVEGHHVQLLCIIMELHEYEMLDFIYKCIMFFGEKMQLSFTSIAKDTQLHNNKVFVNMISNNVITNILVLQSLTIHMKTQPIILSTCHPMIHSLPNTIKIKACAWHSKILLTPTTSFNNGVQLMTLLILIFWLNPQSFLGWFYVMHHTNFHLVNLIKNILLCRLQNHFFLPSFQSTFNLLS